jgi:hypothetical protein
MHPDFKAAARTVGLSLKEQRVVPVMAQQALQALENAGVVVHDEHELSIQDAILVVAPLRFLVTQIRSTTT